MTDIGFHLLATLFVMASLLLFIAALAVMTVCVVGPPSLALWFLAKSIAKRKKAPAADTPPTGDEFGGLG